MSEPRFKQSREIAEAEFSLPVVHEPDIFEDEEPDAFAKIRAYCESGSGSGMLGIYRALPNKKEQFICKLDASDFDPEIIKGRFGGGDFIIKAYDERSKIKLKQHLSIEGEPIIESAKPVYDHASHAPHVQNAPAFDAREFAAMMTENNRQLLTGLAAVMQPQSNGRAEMLQEMLTMKELFSSGQSQQGGIEMIMKGIELARSIEPRAGEATGMDVLLESIKSFAPAIGAVVKQSNQPRRIKASPGAAATTTSPAQPQPLPAESEENMMLKYYIGVLIGFAKENRDPVLYADLIADNLPDEKIMELLNKPDVIGHLLTIHPGVSDVRPWFESVLTELRVIMGLTEPGNTVSVDLSETNLPEKNADSEHGNDGAA